MLIRRILRIIKVKWWVLTGQYVPVGVNCIAGKDGQIYKADYNKPCKFSSEVFAVNDLVSGEKILKVKIKYPNTYGVIMSKGGRYGVIGLTKNNRVKVRYLLFGEIKEGEFKIDDLSPLSSVDEYMFQQYQDISGVSLC